jgi:hypothetical protein
MNGKDPTMARTPNGNANTLDERIPLGFSGLHANVGDHIGHFFNTSDEWESILIPYFKAGLERGDICVYVMSPEEHAESVITAALAEQGIDVEQAQTSGQLVLGEGKPTPEGMEAWLDDVASNVPSRFDLIRWGGDMTWSLKQMPTTETLMTWECICNIKEARAIYLCQYDLTQFLGNVTIDALRTHPLCIIAGTIHRNPYYVPPDIFLDELQRRNAS